MVKHFSIKFWMEVFGLIGIYPVLSNQLLKLSCYSKKNTQLLSQRQQRQQRQQQCHTNERTITFTLWNGRVLAEFVNNLSEIKMVFVPFLPKFGAGCETIWIAQPHAMVMPFQDAFNSKNSQSQCRMSFSVHTANFLTCLSPSLSRSYTLSHLIQDKNWSLSYTIFRQHSLFNTSKS